jgi:hypothetical protein
MNYNIPSDWIFLSKHGNDPYINMLADSVGATATSDLHYEHSQQPIVLRGIMKHKVMKRCWQDQRTFYYVDTGYFGNEPNHRNPRANKIWHRIVPNDLQHTTIRTRPTDRWQSFGRALPTRRHGTNIVIAVPDDKPCVFYGIDRQTWLDDVTQQLSAHTDRPVIVRTREKSRQHRMINRPLTQDLKDAHALITFNSMAAVESVMQGVPAIVLSPTHAAAPVSSGRISDVENPFWPDQDLLHAWLCHLAYSQFNVSEMRSGRAIARLLEDQ